MTNSYEVEDHGQHRLAWRRPERPQAKNMSEADRIVGLSQRGFTQGWESNMDIGDKQTKGK